MFDDPIDSWVAASATMVRIPVGCGHGRESVTFPDGFSAVQDGRVNLQCDGRTRPRRGVDPVVLGLDELFDGIVRGKEADRQSGRKACLPRRVDPTKK